MKKNVLFKLQLQGHQGITKFIWEFMECLQSLSSFSAFPEGTQEVYIVLACAILKKCCKHHVFTSVQHSHPLLHFLEQCCSDTLGHTIEFIQYISHLFQFCFVLWLNFKWYLHISQNALKKFFCMLTTCYFCDICQVYSDGMYHCTVVLYESYRGI